MSDIQFDKDGHIKEPEFLSWWEIILLVLFAFGVSSPIILFLFNKSFT